MYFCLNGGTLNNSFAGCQRVRWAARVRKHNVFGNLNNLKEDETYSYHMTNDSYTDKNKVSRIEK